jgi:hypothetical protein
MTPIYQSNPSIQQAMKSVNDHIHQLCADHINQLVKVETTDGDVFEGHIHHCDRGIVYLRMPDDGSNRGFFPGAFGASSSLVLPLVLFNLLTISLL